MSKTHTRSLRKILPAVFISVFIVALSALAFLPVFGAGRAAAIASADGLDEESMRVLEVCRAYCGNHEFDTVLTGSIRARVFGIPYVQKVHGGREVRSGGCTEVVESVSPLMKAAVRKQANADKCTVAQGAYKNKSFVYGEAREYAREQFVEVYGMPASGLVKYVLDGAVTAAERTGDNEYRYVLDCDIATEYSRNEVRTLSGVKDYPDYDRVEILLIADGSRPAKIKVTEKFRINKLGGISCTAEYIELFTFAER